LIEGTVTAKVLSSQKRREKDDRIGKTSQCENEHYPFRIKSSPGGNRTRGLALTEINERGSFVEKKKIKCSNLLPLSYRGLEALQVNRRHSLFCASVNLNEMVMCLEDLINYFAQPEEDMGKLQENDTKCQMLCPTLYTSIIFMKRTQNVVKC
jgi:hypothetical protein